MLRVLYVVSTGFTGSTLLSFLLNAHPQIATVGEATGPYDLWDDQRDYPCSCGIRLSECEFWNRVSQEMKERGVEFGPNRWDVRFRLTRNRVAHQLLSQSLRNNTADRIRDDLVLRVPPWRARLEQVAHRNVALFASVLAVSGKSVFLDATKDAARGRYLRRLTDLDLFVIHMVRNPLGFVSSFMERHDSLGSGVRYWNRTAGHARRMQESLPSDRFLRIFYEDLCTDTDAQLGRIARFAGLEPRMGPVDFRATSHHVIGSRMRLQSSGEVVLDERWRDRLTRWQVREIRWRTRTLGRQFGYS